MTCSGTASNGLRALTLPTTATTTVTAPNGTNVYTTAYTSFDAYAPLIDVRWRSADSEQADSTTSSGGPNDTSSAASATAPPVSVTTSGSDSLSTGAKVAIGVVIPLAVLALLVVSFIFWRRKRHSRDAAQSDYATVSQSPMRSIGRSAEIHELDGEVRRHELGGDFTKSQEVAGSSPAGTGRPR